LSGGVSTSQDGIGCFWEGRLTAVIQVIYTEFAPTTNSPMPQVR